MKHTCNVECIAECRQCHKDFCYLSGVGGNNEDIEFCSLDCWQDYQERMAEHALEDYYGGSTPTFMERIEMERKIR